MANLAGMTHVFGVSKVAIGNMVKSGIVVKRGPDDYDAIGSCRRYIAHLRKAAEGPNLVAARVRLTEEKARMAELERARASAPALDEIDPSAHDTLNRHGLRSFTCPLLNARSWPSPAVSFIVLIRKLSIDKLPNWLTLPSSCR
jgi:hypothetical protein